MAKKKPGTRSIVQIAAAQYIIAHRDGRFRNPELARFMGEHLPNFMRWMLKKGWDVRLPEEMAEVDATAIPPEVQPALAPWISIVCQVVENPELRGFIRYMARQVVAFADAVDNWRHPTSGKAANPGALPPGYRVVTREDGTLDLVPINAQVRDEEDPPEYKAGGASQSTEEEPPAPPASLAALYGKPSTPAKAPVPEPEPEPPQFTEPESEDAGDQGELHAVLTSFLCDDKSVTRAQLVEAAGQINIEVTNSATKAQIAQMILDQIGPVE